METKQWLKDLSDEVFSFASAHKGELQYIADGYFIEARPHYRGYFTPLMSLKEFCSESEYLRVVNKKTGEIYEEEN